MRLKKKEKEKNGVFVHLRVPLLVRKYRSNRGPGTRASPHFQGPTQLASRSGRSERVPRPICQFVLRILEAKKSQLILLDVKYLLNNCNPQQLD